MNGQRDGETLVSVVIPVFNDQVGLGACLDGLEKQTWPRDRFEIIVVDNNSEPPITMVDRTGLTVRIVRCTRPGSYAARNEGVNRAAGSVLAFIDADCVPEPDWLRRGVSAVRGESSPVVVGGDVLFKAPIQMTITARYQMLNGFGQKENIVARHFSATANLFCERTVFARVGLFDEQLYSGGDREWCWRARRKGVNLCFEPEAIVLTSPRTRFRAAARQARRVAGGRSRLRRMARREPVSPKAISAHPWYESMYRILRARDTGAWERLGMIGVGAALKLVGGVETIRLSAGHNPENR